MTLIWTGGTFSPCEGLPPDDRGLLLADGLFETIRVENAAPRRLSRHMARLTQSAAVFGMAVPAGEDAIRAGLGSLVDTRGLWAVRLTLTRGSGGRGLDIPDEASPTLLLSAARYIPPDGPARLAVSDVRRAARAPSSRHKTLAYIDNVEARRQARIEGFEDAVLLNDAGYVVCAAAANLFWISQGRVFTPALSCGALGGITRACVMRQAAASGQTVEAGRFTRAALEQADAAFLTNALTGVRPVARIGVQNLDAAHPLLLEMKTAEAKAGG